MWLGEVRGLCWQDIEADGQTLICIHIRHNWQDLEGIKPPKYDSNRDVPLVEPLSSLLASFKKKRGSPASSLVFSGDKADPAGSDNAPLSCGYFRIAMSKELTLVGIAGVWHSRKQKPEGYVNEQRERNLTFHSLRHTFVSLSRLVGISDFQTQALAGHKSAQMMDRYSHPTQVVEVENCRTALEKIIYYTNVK